MELANNPEDTNHNNYEESAEPEPDVPVRVGVIGVGYGADIHVPGLQRIPGVHVTAVCAAHLDRASSVANRLRVPEYYGDYREMLQSADLDAVTIAVPPSLHHPVTIAAAEAGFHILCEKPMGLTAAEARDMQRVATDSRLFHAVNYQSRFLPSRLTFHSLVKSGFIGELETVTVTGYRRSWQERTAADRRSIDDGERAAGVLGAVGGEYIDAIRWVFGDITGVTGATLGHVDEARSDYASTASFTAIVRFRNGGLGTVHVAGTAPRDLGDEIVAVGQDGMIAIQSDGRLFGCQRGDSGMRALPVDDPYSEDLLDFPHPRMLPFVVLADEWIRGIRTGEAHPALPTFEDGMKVQEVLHAVQRSEPLSRWVDTSGRKWPVS